MEKMRSCYRCSRPFKTDAGTVKSEVIDWHAFCSDAKPTGDDPRSCARAYLEEKPSTCPTEKIFKEVESCLEALSFFEAKRVISWLQSKYTDGKFDTSTDDY